MRKLNLLAAVAALSLAGGVAVAAEEKPAKPAKEKKICKSEVSSTSRLAKKKICKTRAEWAATSNQEDLDGAEGKMRGGMMRGN